MKATRAVVIETVDPLPTVDHPPHYGGADDPFEAIKVIEAWQANFNIGNVLKYLRRVGCKPGESDIETLQKAAWYLNREIANRQKAKPQ